MPKQPREAKKWVNIILVGGTAVLCVLSFVVVPWSSGPAEMDNRADLDVATSSEYDNNHFEAQQLPPGGGDGITEPLGPWTWGSRGGGSGVDSPVSGVSLLGVVWAGVVINRYTAFSLLENERISETYRGLGIYSIFLIISFMGPLSGFTSAIVPNGLVFGNIIIFIYFGYHYLRL